MEWRLKDTPPEKWADHLASCGGAYFHSPAFVEADEDLGRAWYASLHGPDGVAGVAVVCPRRCRLSFKERHILLPSLPAVRDGVESDYPGLVARLGRRLEERGVAELRMSSFAAPSEASAPAGWSPTRARLEYRVPLSGGPEALRERMSSHHERYVRQGENAGYDLRILEGEEALRALRPVLRTAAARSGEDGFTAPDHPAPDVLRSPDREGWGGSVFGAFDDGELLSAAYVGWAGGKAFYVSGGSTEAGYEGKAAFWMHPAIMAELSDLGFEEYNLGGTPAAAAESGHAQHGLHRFKSGYGPERVRCRGARYAPGALHLSLHRAARRVAGLFNTRRDGSDG